MVRSADNCGKRKTDSGEIKPGLFGTCGPSLLCVAQRANLEAGRYLSDWRGTDVSGIYFVDTEDPQRLEENVHRLAGKAQLLMGGQALAIESSEEILFKELLRGDSQHTVRRFLVQANEAGEIVSAEGILGELLGQIVRKRFRKRVVTLEIPFLGKTHQVELSIRVKDDREKTMKEETI